MNRFNYPEEKPNNPLPIRKIITVVGLVIAVIVLLSMSKSLFETNHQGVYQVKQAFISGKMSVRMVPGTYGQMFGKIDNYKAVATVGFGKEEDEGSAYVDSARVIFNDGSKAAISALVRVELPSTQEGILKLKNDFSGGYDHFIRSGVVPIVENAIKLSANLRSAQDAYTTLALFQQAIQDQLENGMYVTRSVREEIALGTGEKEIKQITEVVVDKNGNPIRVPNKLQDYGCKVSCVIDVPAFDKKVEDMISRRKDEAMKTELAKQAALRATQDALTAEAQGKANVATAQYEKEVEKVKEVTEARKKFEVEQLAAQTALQTAKKIEAEGYANAAANRALVAAGLTPEQKMNMQIQIAEVVSKNIAAASTPSVVIMGEGGGSDNVMKVFGAERAIELVKKFGVDISGK